MFSHLSLDATKRPNCPFSGPVQNTTLCPHLAKFILSQLDGCTLRRPALVQLLLAIGQLHHCSASGFPPRSVIDAWEYTGYIESLRHLFRVCYLKQASAFQMRPNNPIIPYLGIAANCPMFISLRSRDLPVVAAAGPRPPPRVPRRFPRAAPGRSGPPGSEPGHARIQNRCRP